MRFKKLRYQWTHFKQRFTRFTWGGVWATGLPAENRRNLTLFFYDGLFASASNKIILTYTTIYLLSLGATRQQIGLLSSLSNFSAALLLLPAALAVERSGKRKQITVLAAYLQKFVVLMMALLPLLLVKSSDLIWVILGFALLRETFANVAYPGWMALTGDIVPMAGRGQYFGTRNLIMGVAGIFITLVIGEAITRIGEPLGYQISFLLAVILGLISISFYARIKDPHQGEKVRSQDQHGLKGIFRSIKGQPGFIRFCIFTAVWNFSINIVGPFLNVYMVDTLYFSASMIGVATVANTITNLMVQRWSGRLTDKLGTRTVALIFMSLVPLLPLLWGLWVRQFWQAVLMELIGGIIWGAYNLASFNNILIQTPPGQRARYSAFYQIVVTLALSGGAALGAFLIPLIDFKGVAISSTIGRWIAVIIFIFFVHDQTITETP